MPQTSETQNNRPFGWAAFACGFLALAIVVGHFFTGPIDPPPPLEVSLAEKAVQIRDATVAALKGEDYQAAPTAPVRTVDDYITYAGIGLGLVAILIGLIGLIRQEPWRASVFGLALGGSAIAFQYVTIVFFAIIGAIILGALLDKLDFSF